MRHKSILYSLALLAIPALNSLQPGPQAKAKQLARAYMTIVIGADAVSRAHVVVSRSQAGWRVMFRDANAICDHGTWFPGACRFGRKAPYRDVYACVPDTGLIGQVGASGDSPFGNDDLCQWSSPNATTAPAFTATTGTP